jgi:predicted  nucleic acid-binding Zn-ribbon protein
MEGSKLGWVAAVLGAGFLGLLAGQFYTLSAVRSLSAELESVRAEQAGARQALDDQLARLRDADAAAGTERQQALETLRAGVEAARREASGAAGAAGRVQQQIETNIESLAVRLDSNEKRIQESQARLASDLTGVRQASTAAQSGITAVSTEVAAVKSDVAATRSEMKENLAAIEGTRGKLGELSGQIATNAAQIEALRAQGERDYLEFTVFKSRDPVRVGDISLMLKKTDVKNGRYSVDLYVNDLKVEKKDRTINEPLPFYLPGERRPHELVVNQVAQDQITGYVASPKAPAR